MDKLLTQARELFGQYGIKSVTMDDIARSLGISKKTLYQFVDNKADLIEKAIRKHVECEQVEIEKIREEANNAIDEMLAINRYMSQLLRSLNPATINDLLKYYRKAWEIVESLNRHHMYKVIKENMERGISEGLYRDDLKIDIIAKFYVGKAHIIIDTKIFPLREYNTRQLHKEFINYHLNAIVTDKGREMLGALL